MSLLDATAFDAFLEIVDEATEIAKQAVAEAEAAVAMVEATKAARREQPQVILTKVASAETYERVAEVLVSNGFCKAGKSAAVKLLKENGETGLLEFLEKMASTAVFPVDFDSEFDGELVEKKAHTPNHLNSDGSVNQTALYRAAIDEAREELR